MKPTDLDEIWYGYSFKLIWRGNSIKRAVWDNGRDSGPVESGVCCLHVEDRLPNEAISRKSAKMRERMSLGTSSKEQDCAPGSEPLEKIDPCIFR
jgi:hypothetical protein